MQICSVLEVNKKSKSKSSEWVYWDAKVDGQSKIYKVKRQKLDKVRVKQLLKNGCYNFKIQGRNDPPDIFKNHLKEYLVKY